MATVLIASLGDSPVVVTAMLDLLQKEGKGIERLEVFYPDAEFAVVAYEDLICKSLQERCEVDGIELSAEYISSEGAAYEFLHKLFQKLDAHQKNGDVVYLSLAGGRKGMAALATFAAQRKGIRRVVHTVIHERISDRVYEETEVRELQKLRNTRNMKKLHDRLFLRAYQDDKDAFALFTIPVIPVLERTAHDVTSNG